MHFTKNTTDFSLPFVSPLTHFAFQRSRSNYLEGLDLDASFVSVGESLGRRTLQNICSWSLLGRRISLIYVFALLSMKRERWALIAPLCPMLPINQGTSTLPKARNLVRRGWNDPLLCRVASPLHPPRHQTLTQPPGNQAELQFWYMLQTQMSDVCNQRLNSVAFVTKPKW